ncbi:MAG TPA: hypothetical protein PK481_06400 [Bacillota bacterium]|nr:hypothetical protein [Bacillota bacterium]
MRNAKKRDDLIKQLENNLSFIQGSLVNIYRSCGKEGCRCRQGHLHGPAYYISYKEKGRTQMIYIPQALVSQVKKSLTQYKKVKRLVRQIGQANIRQLKEKHVRERQRTA